MDNALFLRYMDILIALQVISCNIWLKLYIVKHLTYQHNDQF